MRNLTRQTAFSTFTSGLICYALVVVLLPFSSVTGSPKTRSNKLNLPDSPNPISSGGPVDANTALKAASVNSSLRHGKNQEGGDRDGSGRPISPAYTPPALRRENQDSRGTETEGLREQPPPSAKGAPAENLPNLKDLRNERASTPWANKPTQPSLPCADCDPQSGGGGSQYYPAGDPNFSTARTLPQNETGAASVDLGSRNFNWSQPLMSLGGRSGMDLGLTLFYNSLVWTNSGSFMKYNADLGTPAPGFRLGFPILQRKFFNSQAGAFSYLMVTPSGGRVEMREVGIGLYESADGAYTQLKENSAYYAITARSSILSAAVAQTSIDNGAPVVLWTNPWNDPNFEWQLVPTDSGYYKLVNHNSGKVAAVAAISLTNGANVVQWDWAEGAAEEQWQIVPIGNGYYKLIARHSLKVLHVQTGVPPQGAHLQQWSDTGALSQQWQFAPGVSTDVTVRTADGTQYTFVHVAVNNEYRCTQIKDRNGNYITATYDLNNGHLQTITDTMGRVVTFVYYPDGNLETIRQTWAGANHDWATFFYGSVTVAPQFGGSLLVNGPNNNVVTVLNRVNLHDGSSYRFDYNTAFGQVKQINHYSADDHLLAYTAFNMDASAGQTDCPRFTQRKVWAKFWNGDAEGTPTPSEESVTNYAVALDNSWAKVTAPDGTIYKEFFATYGWQMGMTTSSRNYVNAADEASDTRKKWTTVTRTQDDENVFYPKNPRVSETNIYDAEGNRKRVTINYGAYASYSLPYEVSEYAADGVTVARRTLKDYNLSSTYLDRRIIGLVSAVNVVDQATGATVSKTTFDYDWSGEYLAPLQQAATQHDATNYGAGFVAGRGNLSVVYRWDVTDIDNGGKAIQQQRIGYNATGSAVFARDALGHQSSIDYADNFSDGLDRNTFAFPKSVTDAEGFQTLTKYNFDFGAVTWRQTPAPNSDQQPPTVSFTYDSEGRIQRVTNDLNSAFTEWVYPNTMTEVNQFTTIAPGSITNEALRAFSTTLLDGAGRARLTASELPPTTGRFSAQRFIYDAMGRVIKQSNPTETTDSWIPAGDDSAWFDTVQAYDWKGRPTQTTNADGTTRIVTYGGCGCAGGEVATLQDEHGRRRRLTKDTFGRLSQVEELNWLPIANPTVYAYTTYYYNARDQLVNTNQAGQWRGFAYDGYGRLESRSTPEQGNTTYSYNADDTTAVITDARGAKTVFGYYPRHLVSSVSYDLSYLVPGQSVASTANVSFTYDAAGNRKTMSDGMGGVSYGYDNLSQLTSETRTINGAPGSYSLGYAYNIVGELTSMTNQWGTGANYGYDKVGRVAGINGPGGVLNYASGLSYRAFGGIKGMNYGDGRSLSTLYDNRMRPTRWDVNNLLGYNYNYDYFNEHTGRVTYAGSIYDPTLDRSYEYDQVGRLVVSHSGDEARSHAWTGEWDTMDGPYSQGYDYDVWGNVTHKVGWGGEVQGGGAGQSSDIYYNYTGNRRNGFSYDASGNLTNDVGQTFTYDATGQQATASYTGYSLQQSYDGDGLRVKKNENGTDSYYLRSTVLGGQVVAELYGSGALRRSYTYLGGQLLALKNANEKGSGLYWVHEDPVTKSKRVTNNLGTVVSTIEMDPWGADTNRSNNAAFQPRKFTSYDRDGNGSDEAMFRRSNRWHSRFDQPDPSNGNYDYTDPQSFNRYAYVQGDPVNLVDPSGLIESWNFCPAQFSSCFGTGGGGYPGTPFDRGSIIFGGYNEVPPGIIPGLAAHDRQVAITTMIYRLLHRGIKGATDGEKDTYWAAMADLISRILSRPECAAVFGGIENAIGSLAGSSFSVENLGYPTMDSTGTIIGDSPDAQTFGNRIEINRQGTFFQGSQLTFPTMMPGLSMTVTVDTWGLQGSTWGALVIGHELGHVIGIFGKNDSDAHDPSAGRANTQRVYDACFK